MCSSLPKSKNTRSKGGWSVSFAEFQRSGVMAQCCYVDFHERIKWKRVQDLVEFPRAFHVEDTDVCELARYPPEMEPLSLFLEYLGALVFLLAKFLDVLRIRIVRDTDIYVYVEQHSGPPARYCVYAPDTGLCPAITCSSARAYSEADCWFWPVTSFPST